MLLEEALALGAELELGTQVDSIDSSGTQVTLADGTTREADVVVGADGKTLPDFVLTCPIWRFGLIEDYQFQVCGHPPEKPF